MEDLLNRAFEALKSLPERDQSALAWEIIERVDNKIEWDTLVATSKAQAWMADEAAQALKKFQKKTRNLSLAFMTVENDNFLREDSFWRHFDDLPKQVKDLAGENYRLWKDNPNHPSLRFKQIHKTLPIFSFRVGMQHRCVGVQTDDDKVVWFWMGSFDHFKELIDGTPAAA